MKTRKIFYDTETTGIKADKDRIIELAAYDPDTDTTFERLINPGMRIPPEASAVHHITDEMVANAPGFQEVIQEFMEFCSGDTVLIAHNNDNFDFHFLKHEFARCNLDMPDWRFFDTLKWARRYRKDLPRHSLQFLREVYDIPANNAHRALDDVIVLHKVYCYMTDDLDIGKVYELINRPMEFKEITHMPFGKHQGVPLPKVPKSYIQWLAGTGAFNKPENQELHTTLLKLGLLEPAAT